MGKPHVWLEHPTSRIVAPQRTGARPLRSLLVGDSRFQSLGSLTTQCAAHVVPCGYYQSCWITIVLVVGLGVVCMVQHNTPTT
ncbi:hypothetical protein F4782DRAFT_533929 [Xylaria castorea]|nr:hypothetical protein F4782DRAFT_533929 [Xylaria castorea]